MKIQTAETGGWRGPLHPALRQAFLFNPIEFLFYPIDFFFLTSGFGWINIRNMKTNGTEIKSYFKQKDIADAAGIACGYLSMILNRKHPYIRPSWSVAVRLGKATGTDERWWADKEIDKILAVININVKNC